MLDTKSFIIGVLAGFVILLLYAEVINMSYDRYQAIESTRFGGFIIITDKKTGATKIVNPLDTNMPFDKMTNIDQEATP